MKRIQLDDILLFALLVPFIMTYRLSPGITPYWLFGLVFLGLFCYVGINFISLKKIIQEKIKLWLLWFLIISTIGTAMLSAIIVRHETAPIYGVHDIILQQESAMQFLLNGTNPYSATYFNTPLKDWHYSDTDVNPALYHFVMEPFYLLFAYPFYFFTLPVFGFFDSRIPLAFLFLVLIFLASRLVKDRDLKRQFMILLAFNPAMLGYFIEGRDDIFMYSFFFLGLFLLYKKRFLIAGIPIALAFATKQSIWPFFPFYLAFLYFQNKNILKTIKQLIPFTVTFLIIVLPFFLWNPHAFLASTLLYLSGNDPHSYPVAGYGLGSLLHQIGIIKNVNAYYPFTIWQVVIALPVLGLLINLQRKNNSIGKMITFYGLFLFVFWYLSRYFNNSHLGYLSMVFITAYFWPEE